jgi:hypothetical protein
LKRRSDVLSALVMLLRLSLHLKLDEQKLRGIAGSFGTAQATRGCQTGEYLAPTLRQRDPSGPDHASFNGMKLAGA